MVALIFNINSLPFDINANNTLALKEGDNNVVNVITTMDNGGVQTMPYSKLQLLLCIQNQIATTNSTIIGLQDNITILNNLTTTINSLT